MDLISEFIISSIGNEVEEIVMYDDYDTTEEKVKTFLEKLIKEKKIIIGEKCEGTIEMDKDKIFIEYRWCSKVGEDWNSDVWEDEEITLNRVDYEL